MISRNSDGAIDACGAGATLVLDNVANILLVGADAHCEAAIEAMRAELLPPIVTWRRRERLLLPPQVVTGTLILLGIEDLDRIDQQRLLDWRNGPGNPRVIATAAVSLLADVERQAFLPTLYERLNPVCIDRGARP